jgi:arylsulfatase A-like enzyme
MKPQVSTTPVSLLDIYPTLTALCGLQPPTTHELDGVNLTAVLSGVSKDRGQPVLSTYGRGNHSLRDERFRYTRFRDGNEELYDHRYDPHEWRNLAAAPRFAAVKARLAAHLPEINAPEVEYASNQDRDADGNRWVDEAFD